MNKRLFLTLLIILIIGGIIAGFFSSSMQKALTLPMSVMMGMNNKGQQVLPGTNKTLPGLMLTPKPGAKNPANNPMNVIPPAQVKPNQDNVLAQDTFQRANQLLWGQASDGLTWGGDANTQNVFSIKGATGKIAHGNGAVDAILGPTKDNVDVQASGSVNQFGNGVNLGVVLRWTNAQNWYKALIDGQHLSILKSVNGNTSQLSAIPFNAQAGQVYKIRFSAIGAMLFVKAWRSDQQEPAHWMSVDSDRELISGHIGVRVVLTPNTIIHMTSFVAAPAHMMAAL